MAFSLKFLRTMLGLSALATLAPGCAATAEPSEQAVIIYLKLSDSKYGAEGESFALYDVEEAVERTITNVGEFAGHEIGGGYFTIFTYGPNADSLFQEMRPALDSPLVRRGSYVLVRRGGAGVPVDRVELSD